MSSNRLFVAARWIVSVGLLAVALSFFALTAAAQSMKSTRRAVATGSQHSPAAQALHRLFEVEWEYQLAQNPGFASFLGDKRYNDRWTDLSLTAIAARHEHDQQTLAQLVRINRAQLSAADQLNYDLFKKDLDTSIEGYQFRGFLLPVNQRGGVQAQDELAELLRFNSIKDYENWIKRLNALPQVIEQTTALMRLGMREKILWPRVVLERVTAQIDKQVVADAEQSPFYAPLKTFPADISESERTRLRAAAQQAITSNVVPAYRAFRTFFVDEYLPASFPQVGAWQMTNGAAYYAYLVRVNTTTNQTPEQIHRTGLKEVARIRAEMEKIKTQVGFNGTLKEFFQYLRSDPKFFYKTPDELLNAYRAIAKRIDPNLTKVFRTLPRAPYGVTPIPDKIAPDTTTAYYNSPAADGSRPGYYYVNLYRPEVRPKWEMMALSLHESVPGHHLQIALAQELGELPKFRRYGGYTAFVEGWGLYAESLGEDMGLYDDPYDKFGQLTYEMWRAVRLVVDTGMLYYKWERQRA